MVFKLFQSIEYSQFYHKIFILIIITILNNILKNRVIKTLFFRYLYDDLYLRGLKYA